MIDNFVYFNLQKYLSSPPLYTAIAYGAKPNQTCKRRRRPASSLRSKRFRGAKMEEWGFSAFCPRKIWSDSCSRTAQKRLLRRLNRTNFCKAQVSIGKKFVRALDKLYIRRKLNKCSLR